MRPYCLLVIPISGPKCVTRSPNAAAIDVVDTGNEKDERNDPPAQTRYGTSGLQRVCESGGARPLSRSGQAFVPRLNHLAPSRKKSARDDCSNV
jgi:hypothetical protein